MPALLLNSRAARAYSGVGDLPNWHLWQAGTLIIFEEKNRHYRKSTAAGCHAKDYKVYESPSQQENI